MDSGVVEALLNAGANAELANGFGDTPRTLADAAREEGRLSARVHDLSDGASRRARTRKERMMDWTEVPPIIAAVAAAGLLIVAVVNLCSNLLSKTIDKRDARLGEAIDRQGEQLGEAIDRQGEQLEKHERKNADEHSALGKRIDQVDTKITETNRKVDSGFDKVNETLRIIDGNVRELVGRFKERDSAAERVDRERDK